MSMISKSSKSVKKVKDNPKLKLDTTQRNDIKKKAYLTRQLDSSIAILDSPEDSIVLEALLYLIKMSEQEEQQLKYFQEFGLLQKLLNLLNRNVCILRLSLKILANLIKIDDIMVELDQDIYDDKILKIAHMYISSTDLHIRQYAVSILSKVAKSCRITTLIFKIDLFNPILDTIRNTTDKNLLETTLELILSLLSAPAALSILPEMYTFDISILMMHLAHTELSIVELSFKIIHKLTFYCLEVFQKMFKEAKLIERMFEVLMDDEKQAFHEIALEIVVNSMKSDETCSYFIESVEFLKFCQWVKTCDPDYLYASIIILERITRVRSKRQILFDLSVEDSILFCLRSTEKRILNKTCSAISNMTSHRYCCEKMLTPVVLKELFNMLLRKDEEDPGNEIALKTIIDFSRRNVYTLDMIHAFGLHKILIAIFKKGMGSISEECFLGVLEILYKMSLHPLYQKEVIEVSYFEKLINIFQSAPVRTAIFICEILTSYISLSTFRRVFQVMNGAQLIVGILQTCKNTKLMKSALLFIYGALIYDPLLRTFLQNNLIRTLKEFPQKYKQSSPILTNILKLVYSFHMPLKLFEVKRLHITEQLGNKFYIINGNWKHPFPFLELLEMFQMSTMFTIYVVDYSFEVVKPDETISDTISTSDLIPLDRGSKTSLDDSPRRNPYKISYGKLSPDPFLPRYIYHVQKCVDRAQEIEEKVHILADFTDTMLCGPKDHYSLGERIRIFQKHILALKTKLGTSMIPIGYLRVGFHCERSLLFKAIADKCNIPTSLVKGKSQYYWNEVAVLDVEDGEETLRMYVVDLMDNIGNLLLVGSKAANLYCNIET